MRKSYPRRVENRSWEGPKWYLEASGKLLGARWAHFGSRGGSEAEFERLLGTLGALLVALGPLRGPFGALLGPLGALLGTIFASRNARFEGL